MQIMAGKELDAAWSPLSNQALLADRDRAFARQLILTTLRHYGSMHSRLGFYLKKRAPQRAEIILLLGMTQILWLETPLHAAVDTSVSLAKSDGMQPFSGMINAVLKRIAQSAEEVRAACDPLDNLPKWLRKKVIKDYGKERARAIAQAHLEPPSLDITLRGAEGEADWPSLLEATMLPTGSLRRALSHEISGLPGFTEGAWWVQDAASALPVRLFSDLHNKETLDLCAAPGGKTLQMAARGAHVTAIDRSASRLHRLTENLHRTGLKATLTEADARNYQPVAPPERILLDAPCTATGTLRRHPDVALHRQPADLTELCALQAAMLAHALRLLPRGGELVYCVCSLLKEEGEAQIISALANDDSLALRPAVPEHLGIPPSWVTPEGFLRILPSDWAEMGGIDGFFAACIRRT